MSIFIGACYLELHKKNSPGHCNDMHKYYYICTRLHSGVLSSVREIKTTYLKESLNINPNEFQGMVEKKKNFSNVRRYVMLWVYNDLLKKSGVIYVVDELDYEQKKQYELTVRATDSVSGVYAEVLVSILVLDVNDCPPEFTQDSYNVSVSEAAPFGTSILRVYSRDNDTGKLNTTVFVKRNLDAPA